MFTFEFIKTHSSLIELFVEKAVDPLALAPMSTTVAFLFCNQLLKLKICWELLY